MTDEIQKAVALLKQGGVHVLCGRHPVSLGNRYNFENFDPATGKVKGAYAYADPGLDGARAEAQSRGVAEKLKVIFDQAGFEVAEIWTSPMARALQDAVIKADTLGFTGTMTCLPQLAEHVGGPAGTCTKLPALQETIKELSADKPWKFDGSLISEESMAFLWDYDLDEDGCVINFQYESDDHIAKRCAAMRELALSANAGPNKIILIMSHNHTLQHMTRTEGQPLPNCGIITLAENAESVLLCAPDHDYMPSKQWLMQQHANKTANARN